MGLYAEMWTRADLRSIGERARDPRTRHCHAPLPRLWCRAASAPPGQGVVAMAPRRRAPLRAYPGRPAGRRGGHRRRVFDHPVTGLLAGRDAAGSLGRAHSPGRGVATALLRRLETR
ncbi:hypothetical protein GCM10027294_22090 [Marinactinospora endophytica]